MSNAYKVLLFLTLLAFAYLSSTMTAGRAFNEYWRWVMLAVMASFALWSPPMSPRHFKGQSLRIAAVAFAAFATISSMWSLQRSFYTFARGISVCFLVVLVFFSLWPRLRSLKDYVSLVGLLSLLAWFTVFASVFLFVFKRSSAIRPFTGAFQGMFGNPNTLGMTYAVLTPISLSRFYLKKGPIRFALPLILLAFAWLSQSRAGLVGALGGIGAFYAAYYGRKIWIVVLLLFVIAAPFFLLRQERSVLDEAETEFWRGESSIQQYGSGRFGLWMAAFQRFKERPFTGYGFGTGGDCYMPNGESFRWHSSFTQIGVELGIAGLLFFFAPIAYSGAKVARYHVLTVRNPRVRAAAGGLMAGWLAGAANSLFESWLFSVGNFSSIIAWIAFAAGVKAMSEAALLDEQAGVNAAPRT